MELIFSIFILWNLTVFFIYASDKRRAVSSKRRVSEKTMLSTALCFGAVGALTAVFILRHKTRKRIFMTAIFFCVLINIFLLICINSWANTKVFPSRYTVSGSDIPPEFDGFKIAVISDIQGTDRAAEIRELLEAEKPDAVFFAGDLVDEAIPESDKVFVKLMDSLHSRRNLFGVTGNHDLLWDGIESFCDDISKKYSLTFLSNSKAVITIGSESINIYGIADPKYWQQDKADETTKSNLELVLKSNPPEKDDFNILIFHRANMLDMFRDEEFDLIVSGHMHGGQVYIPFIGGLVSPGYKLFPKYSAGRYSFGDKTYIVSRGIGNAVRVPRIMNPPDIPIIILKSI